MKSFDEIFVDKTKYGVKVQTTEYSEVGEHIIIDQGQSQIAGYTDRQEGLFEEVPVVIFGDHTRVIKYVDEPFFLGADGVKVLRSKDDNANYKYLYYALKNARIPDTGYNRHFKWLKEVQINYPDSDKQAEIVDILDNVSSVIKKREDELCVLDDLIKARFVEMFGGSDSELNRWKQEPLGNICKRVKRYPTFCNMEYLESGVRVIRIGNILQDGHMDVEDKNYVFVYEKANDDFPETIIERNDIVMAVRGDGSAASRIGIITEEKLIGANISPNLIRMQADSEKILPLFFFYYLTGEVGQKRLDSYVNKTAKKNIAAKDIVKVMTPIPPLDIQRQFVSLVEQVDKSKVVVASVR